jgi:hypothetical protein
MGEERENDRGEGGLPAVRPEARFARKRACFPTHRKERDGWGTHKEEGTGIRDWLRVNMVSLCA